MELFWKSPALWAACNREPESVRSWGADGAAAVRRRLFDLQAAHDVAMLGLLPQARLRELADAPDGGSATRFEVSAGPSLRIIFEPADGHAARAGGAADATRVTAIRILAVEDTHGR